MKVAIIGAGNLGSGLAKRLLASGHDVTLAFSRSETKLAETVAALGPGASSADPAEAARRCDLIALCTTWGTTVAALKLIAAACEGKVVWDCTNPIKEDFSGLAVGTDVSGGETIARHLPGARLVKAIPPFAEVLHSNEPMSSGEVPSVFVCSDDEDARERVCGLIWDLGASPTAAGPLSNARYTEPAGFLLVQLAYGLGRGARIGLRFIDGKRVQ